MSWQFTIEKLRPTFIINWRDDFLVKCKVKKILTVDEYKRIKKKKKKARGYIFLDILKTKKVTVVQKFCMVLYEKNYKILSLKILISINPEQRIEDKISCEIDRVIGQYLANSKTQNRDICKLELSLALTELYQTIQNKRINEIEDSDHYNNVTGNEFRTTKNKTSTQRKTSKKLIKPEKKGAEPLGSLTKDCICKALLEEIKKNETSQELILVQIQEELKTLKTLAISEGEGGYVVSAKDGESVKYIQSVKKENQELQEKVQKYKQKIRWFHDKINKKNLKCFFPRMDDEESTDSEESCEEESDEESSEEEIDEEIDEGESEESSSEEESAQEISEEEFEEETSEERSSFQNTNRIQDQNRNKTGGIAQQTAQQQKGYSDLIPKQAKKIDKLEQQIRNLKAKMKKLQDQNSEYEEKVNSLKLANKKLNEVMDSSKKKAEQLQKVEKDKKVIEEAYEEQGRQMLQLQDEVNRLIAIDEERNKQMEIKEKEIVNLVSEVSDIRGLIEELENLKLENKSLRKDVEYYQRVVQQVGI